MQAVLRAAQQVLAERAGGSLTCRSFFPFVFYVAAGTGSTLLFGFAHSLLKVDWRKCSSGLIAPPRFLRAPLVPEVLRDFPWSIRAVQKYWGEELLFAFRWGRG